MLIDKEIKHVSGEHRQGIIPPRVVIEFTQVFSKDLYWVSPSKGPELNLNFISKPAVVDMPAIIVLFSWIYSCLVSGDIRKHFKTQPSKRVTFSQRLSGFYPG